MKFYGHGIVWNPEKNNKLCRFENGEYETEDSDTAKMLAMLGFKHDGDIPAEEKQEEEEQEQEQDETPVDYSELTNEELKEILYGKGIEYKARATKSELIELLQGTD